MLDIASGPGTSALQLARAAGGRVVGIDLTPAAAAAATNRAHDAGLADAVSFLCADARALPLADGCASGALCECALCLFPDKPAAAREIARVLRPGARLALSDVTADHARLPADLRTLDAFVACLGGARPLEATAALLATAGLEVERVDRRDDVLLPFFERIASRLRLARLAGGGPLADLLDRADLLLAAARGALADRSLGYGVIVARRPA